MAHTFEWDGVTVEFYPALVRTRQIRNRLMTKLLLAHGYQDTESTPDGEWERLHEYANSVSRSCARGAVWWVDSDASLEQVRLAFEAFQEQPERLYDLFVTAIKETEPPKKTVTNTETKSE